MASCDQRLIVKAAIHATLDVATPRENKKDRRSTDKTPCRTPAAGDA